MKVDLKEKIVEVQEQKRDVCDQTGLTERWPTVTVHRVLRKVVQESENIYGQLLS